MNTHPQTIFSYNLGHSWFPKIRAQTLTALRVTMWPEISGSEHFPYNLYHNFLFGISFNPVKNPGVLYIFILSNYIRNEHEKEDLNLIEKAIFALFIFYSLKRKDGWKQTMSTFLSSQIHLKNIRIEKWFTISGGKNWFSCFLLTQLPQITTALQ